MRQGGYKIINLKGVNVNTPGATIAGVYDAIKSTRKPIIVSGLVIGNKEFHDVFVNFKSDGSTYSCTFDNVTLTVSNADLVVGVIA